jgi:hypothetical protein
VGCIAANIDKPELAALEGRGVTGTRSSFNLSSSRRSNSFRISSRSRRVYTTLRVETEAVGKADAQQVEKRFLLGGGLGHAAQPYLTTDTFVSDSPLLLLLCPASLTFAGERANHIL